MTLQSLIPTGRAMRAALSLLFVAAGTALIFSSIELGGVGEGDEGYQLMCVENYSTSPLGMFSYWTGHLWMNLFGGEVLALRALVSLTMLLAIFIGCFYCWRRTGNMLLAAALVPVCAMGNRLGDFPIFNWDTGTYLYDAIALVALLSFTERPRWWKAAVAGAAIALMTLGRLPLGIELLLAMAVVWASCRAAGLGWSRILTFWGIGLGAFTVCALLAMTAMCGSPAAYAASFVPENFITGHGAGDLSAIVRRLWYLLPRQIWYLAIGMLALAAAVAVCLARRHKAAVAVTATCALIYYSTLMIIEGQYGSVWSWLFLGSFLSVFLIVLFWYPMARMMRPADNPGAPVPWLQLLTILGFITLISFGSDTFFERMCGVFALPMAVGVTWPLMRGGERHMLKVYLIFFMVAFGSIWTTRQYHQYRLYRVPMDEFPHQRGLLAHPVQYGGYKVNRAAIESCRRNGKSYMVFGARLNLLYTFGPDDGYPYHWFDSHLFRYPGGYIEAIKPYAERTDAVIYAGEMGISYDELVENLAPMGYVPLWRHLRCSIFVKKESAAAVGRTLREILDTDPFLRRHIIRKPRKQA